MRWVRLTLGLGFAVMAGTVLGRGWADGDALLSPLGTLTLILGVLTALSALLGPRPADQQPEEELGGASPGAPVLGQMLLGYGLITEAQLERALEQHERTGKRIGRVLVEMGMVTHAQVAEVLDEQLSRRGLRLVRDGERVGAGRSDVGDSLHPSVRWEGYREDPSGQGERQDAR